MLIIAKVMLYKLLGKKNIPNLLFLIKIQFNYLSEELQIIVKVVLYSLFENKL